MKTIHRAGWLAAGLLFLAAGVLHAQRGTGQSQGNSTPTLQPPSSPTTNQPTMPGMPGMGTDDSPRSPLTRTEEDLQNMRNNDRQKKLVEDTQKLLALANELKLDVDKSSKDTLSLEVIKKADEIEKLAHSVKEKMKGS